MNLDEMVTDELVALCEENLKERLGIDKIPDDLVSKLDNAIAWKEGFVQNDVFDVISDAACDIVDKILEERGA